MNIRIVRKKIKSVDNVKKITKAMELVSAVKMKKFHQLAEESTPYQMFLEKTYIPYITIDTTKDRLTNISNIRNLIKDLEQKKNPRK